MILNAAVFPAISRLAPPRTTLLCYNTHRTNERHEAKMAFPFNVSNGYTLSRLNWKHSNFATLVMLYSHFCFFFMFVSLFSTTSSV